MSELWQNYFDQENLISTPRGTFHIYIKGDSSPVVLCLHGAGSNGLSWALMTKHLHNALECKIIALDLRGHGQTTTNNEHDLSLRTLAEDVVEVSKHLPLEQDGSFIILGYNLGGSVGIEAANYIKNLEGLWLVDTLEGRSEDKLESFLNERPTHFRNIHHAIQWYFSKSLHQNLEVAKLIITGQIINVFTGKLAIHDNESDPVKAGTSSKSISPPQKTYSTSEHTDSKYTWRTDLNRSRHFWSQWFTGLHNRFLMVVAPKILIIPHTKTLDTVLSIGQRQGKFLLKELPKSIQYNVLHEDRPGDVADMIVQHLLEHRMAVKRLKLQQGDDNREGVLE